MLTHFYIFSTLHVREVAQFFFNFFTGNGLGLMEKAQVIFRNPGETWFSFFFICSSITIG